MSKSTILKNCQMAYNLIFLSFIDRVSSYLAYYNVAAFVTRRLIGYHQNFATVYPARYCRKQFDDINYVTFCWMECSFMRLATHQDESKLQKCIRMGLKHIQTFHLGWYIVIYTFGNH